MSRTRPIRPARRYALALAVLLAATAAVRAEPSPPWTPSLAARHSLALLVDEAGLGLPLTQWPLPRGAVMHAIDALPRELAPALDEARARVVAELRDAEGAAGAISVRGHDEALAGFGDDATPGSSLRLRSGTASGHGLALQVGGRLDLERSHPGAQFRLDDAAIAVEALGAQFQAWSHRSWWSPGWQSSLVLGDNAPPFNGIGLQRASVERSQSRWLAWLGPWTYDLFMAQADDSIHSYFVGTRITMRPLPLLEIGLTRTAQWGGRGHPQSVKSFLRMLAGVGVNADNPLLASADPANEMSGYDVRLRCGFGLRCAAYTQLIGEDEAGHLPAKFLGLYGGEWWSADGRQRWFAEFLETICGAPLKHEPTRGCAYRNHAYPEGYAHAMRWIGAGAGPDSRVWTLGWMDAATGTSLRVSGGRIGARIGVFGPQDDPEHSGRMIGVSARQAWSWGPATLGAELDWLRIVAPLAPRNEARLGFTLRLGLDEAARAARTGLAASLAVRDGDVLRPLLTGAALVAGAALLDRPLDDYARVHASNDSSRAMRRAGDAAPFIGFGLAGASWLASRGSERGDVGFSAVASGVTSVAIAELAKIAVDRARPKDGLGPASFGEAKPRTDSSFPSIHSTLAWAVATPYAQHYDLPWLYGVAALTDAARVAGRAHWLSDAVAGAVLGYAIGDYAYRRTLRASDDGLELRIGVGVVELSKPF